MKVPLTQEQKALLRKNKIKLSDLADYTPAQLGALLQLPQEEAARIIGTVVFQGINSIGHKFAADLVEMGYYDLASLRGKLGSDLLDAHERLKGYQTDPCVEDQFRRVVHYVETGDNALAWPDFTGERKAFRAAHGYPATRPGVHWTEVFYAR